MVRSTENAIHLGETQRLLHYDLFFLLVGYYIKTHGVTQLLVCVLGDVVLLFWYLVFHHKQTCINMALGNLLNHFHC